MMNVIVHGERGDESKGPMLIQQVDRIDNTAGQTNALVKQIVRLDAARRHDTKALSREVVTMKHFWGGRLYNWTRTENLGKAKQEKLFSTTVQNNMTDIPSGVLQCF
jgi:hypothetical protein